MNEFVEKLIERLEERKNRVCSPVPDYSEGLENGYENAISIVKELAEEYAKDTNVPTNNGWIAVEDRLPDEDGEYLCQIGADKPRIGVYSFAKNLKKVDKYDFAGKNHSGFYDYDSEYGYFKKTGVVAWRELPHAYQPKKI